MLSSGGAFKCVLPFCGQPRKNFVLYCNSNYESNELRERESSLAFHGVVMPQSFPQSLPASPLSEYQTELLIPAPKRQFWCSFFVHGSVEVYNGFTVLSWCTFPLLTPFLRLALVNYCTYEVVTNVVWRKWRGKIYTGRSGKLNKCVCVLDRLVFCCRRSYKRHVSSNTHVGSEMAFFQISINIKICSEDSAIREVMF